MPSAEDAINPTLISDWDRQVGTHLYSTPTDASITSLPFYGFLVVIIPAHNEGQRIARTLESLRQQTRQADAVIVVADNCTDDTIQVALAEGVTVVETVGNFDRKAGALNQTLNSILPKLDGDDVPVVSFTEAFSRALVDEAQRDDRIVALTAAMAGPTGLVAFQKQFPSRFFDVGIAEQHEMTAAAGMAIGGLKPVVCVYSTFFSRAFDQANLDVGLLNLPVVMVFDRAGITGDDGPSHHGVLDIALCLAIPGVTIFAPSSIEEVPVMLHSALEINGPTAIRFPKTTPKHIDGKTGSGLAARKVVQGDGSLCVIAVGKMLGHAFEALDQLGLQRDAVTLYDARVIPPDHDMITDALTHQRVLTIEDGVLHGGAGALVLARLRVEAQAQGVAMPVSRILGVPRAFLQHHTPDALLAEIGLDVAGIAGAMTRFLDDEPAPEFDLPLAPRPRYL